MSAGPSEQQRLWAAPTSPIVAGTLALMTLIAVESFAVTTVLPVVAADLDGTRWYSFAFAATITTALVGMVVGGSWADRSGITAPLVCGGLLFTTGIGLCVIAQDMSVFVLGRLLQGLGGGIDSVLVYVIIAKHIPQHLQSRMFGLLAAAWLVPSMVGPLVAGALTELINWRAVFAAVFLGSALALGLLVRTTRTPTIAAASTDHPIFGRAGWLASGAALCLLVLHLGGQQDFPLGGLLLGAGLVGLVVAASRLLPSGSLTASPGIPAFITTRGLLGAAVGATDVYLPLYLQAERGFAPARAGAVVAIGALGWALGAWVQGRERSSRYSDTLTIRAATVLVLCGPTAVAAYVTDLAAIPVPIAGCILMGTGMGLAYPRITSGVIKRSTPDHHGQHSSALQASESMATSGFLALTGAVLTAVGGSSGYLTVYALAVGAILLCVCASNRLGT